MSNTKDKLKSQQSTMTITQELLTMDSVEAKQEAFFLNDHSLLNLSILIKHMMLSLWHYIVI